MAKSWRVWSPANGERREETVRSRKMRRLRAFLAAAFLLAAGGGCEKGILAEFDCLFGGEPVVKEPLPADIVG